MLRTRSASRWLPLALASIVVAVAAPVASALGAGTPPRAAVSEDLDGDGVAERITVAADGALEVVSADGAPMGRVGPPAGTHALGGSRVEVVRAGGRTYVHAHIEIDGRSADVIAGGVGRARTKHDSGIGARTLTFRRLYGRDVTPERRVRLKP